MISAWHLVVISLLYILSLFAVAWYGDRQAQRNKPLHNNGVVYSLSIAVYCTSWTFYGAVGQAATSGWLFMAIYAGPIIFLMLFWRVLSKIIRIAKDKRITSIADFVGTRYGRDHSLAMLITLVALLSLIPYLALQLKAIATTFELLSNTSAHQAVIPFWQDTAFHISWMMALFVIVFGTRDIDASEQHPGMILAIAFESIVKLGAILIIGFWVVNSLYERPLDFIHLAKINLPDHALFTSKTVSLAFILQSLLAGFAILCLPRQFQVAVIENNSHDHLKTARWLFPLYLLLMVIFVVPITLSGQLFLADTNLPPDTFVVSLPMIMGESTLATIAFIGGGSAATGMIIVATIAISTMISNELILPYFFRKAQKDIQHPKKIRALVLSVRRMVITLVMLAAYLFYRAVTGVETLAVFGLLSFAAAAQFAPALLGGLIWQGANRQGAIAGILGGTLVWFLTLLWPVLSQQVIPGASTNSLFLGFALDDFSIGVILSLWVNISLFIFFSAATNASVRERMLASDFASTKPFQPSNIGREFHCKVDDVRVVLERILGSEKANLFFYDFQKINGELRNKDLASVSLLRNSEKLLASVVGSSSARVIFTTLLGGEQIQIHDLASLASEASQAYVLSREQLQAAVENLHQGVSVIDKDLNLIAWNKRYLEIFDYPNELIVVGQPIANIIEYNAKRGYCGTGEIHSQIARRMQFLRSRSAHHFERELPSGMVISMQGHPMPDGGFVTSFTDITMHKKAEKALKEANVSLEQQVEESSQELTDLTARLIEANTSKTRFLAAAGHDLMQPLNAAKLFASTLSQHHLTKEQSELLDYLEGSLQSAEDVLSTLVEISKLDAGAMEPSIQPLSLKALLKPLRDEFTALAADKGLELRTHCGDYWVLGDALWLRRIIQNLLSNAVRYTSTGGILLGCRKRGNELAIEVWDTGPGIPKSKLKEIFQEFKRLQTNRQDSKGLGLGLAIVERMTKRLGYRIEVDSWIDSGSRFRLLVPLTEPLAEEAQPVINRGGTGGMEGLKTFVIDNDPEVLAGMNALLSSWQCQIYSSHDINEALQIPFEPQIMLADHQLDNDETGLEAMQLLREKFKKDIPGVLITADLRPEIETQAKDLGFYFLRKPMKPAALRALIRRMIR